MRATLSLVLSLLFGLSGIPDRPNPALPEPSSLAAHGALSPADVGKVLTRQIRLVGDDLTIEFQTLSTDGVQVTRVLKWKRVG